MNLPGERKVREEAVFGLTDRILRQPQAGTLNERDTGGSPWLVGHISLMV